MKRFLASLSTISLIEVIGRHPAMAAGMLSLLGVGGGAVISGMLTTPTPVPQVSSNFNPNQSPGYTLNGLKFNQGVSGAGQLPANAPDSAAFYGEMTINSNLSGALGVEVPFNGAILNHYQFPGQPDFFFQRNFLNISNISWWLNAGATIETSGSATAGSSYATGFYPFTAPSSGCARAPTGVWQGGSTIFQQVDPGFGCPVPATALSLNAAAIAANVPGSGAQQATGAGSQATTCAVVNSQAVVTAHVAVAHGVTPGIPYPLAAFTPTGYNGTYTALYGTTGTTLVGTTGAGSCPAAVTAEGTALAGTGGALTFPLASTTTYGNAPTGITTKSGQHICFWLNENGDNSAFPGSQSLEMVDDKGNPLPGSPAIVPNLNQGISSFVGYMTTGGQPQLTVTGLNSASISAASFNATTGYSTFTTSTNTGYVPGSEFTVSGLTSTGPGSFNLTYVAVAGTSGATVVANPLSGPAGVPTTSALTGSSAWSSGGSMASVVLPGAQIYGATNGTLILPYGTASSTGTGGTGTYALTGSQPGYSFTVSAVSGSGPWTITVTGSPAQNIVIGTTFTLSSVSSTTFTITGLGTGTSGAGTYTATSTGSAPLAGTATAAAIGSSGSPVVIADYSLFYFNQSGTTANSAGLTLSARTGSSIADFFSGSSGPSILGSASSTFNAVANYGWGGSLGNFATLWGVLPHQSGGAPSTSDLASICTKHTDIQTYAAANSLTLNSLYRLNDPGIWADSGNATITGYITNVGGSAATLNVSSTTLGSLALSTGTETAYLTGAGLPIASPVTIPLTTSGASTYAITPNTTAALGSSGSPVTFAVGAFKPALPIQSNTLKGYIDTTSGVSTLHVTSLDDGSSHVGFASFTGSLNTTFTGSTTSGSPTLTVSSPTSIGPGILSAVIGPGMTVYSGTTLLGTVQSQATTTATSGFMGLSGTYTLSANATATASGTLLGGCASPSVGCLAGPPTNLTVSGVTGTIAIGMGVTDGGASITGSPLLITAGSGTTWTVAGNYYPPVQGDATMAASFSTVVPGEYIQNSSITNPVKVVGYQTGAIGQAGNYTLSGPPNAAGTVGSAGSPVVFAGTTITDGGAIAPGPALTIRDLGPGITFPLNLPISSSVGAITASGTYDTSFLGGAPSAVQAQVSLTANGAPISGCSACAWTNLASYTATPYTFAASITTGGAMTVTSEAKPAIGNAFTGAGYNGTITANTGVGTYTVSPAPGSAVPSETMTATTVHNWTGRAANIPGGGPYFVSVRAANGIAYATLPNSVKVGLIFALYGQGQADSMQGAQSGNYTSWFPGLWGTSGWGTISSNSLDKYLQGPPVTANFLTGLTGLTAGDRFAVAGGGAPLSEAVITFDQELQSAFGAPATFLPATRDGVGAGLMTFGNTMQTQTVGGGDGSTTVWCSASTFCGSSGVSPAGQLVYGAATLTGGWFSGTVGVNGSSQPIVTATTRIGGALEPGMVLNTPNAPTLVRCLTLCGGSASAMNYAGSTWLLSSNADNGVTGAMRADAPASLLPFGLTSTPWPNLNVQANGGPVYGWAGFGVPLIKAGTFFVTVNGATVCQDNQLFAYNNTGGNCTGAGVTGFVNYQTGDYQINFTTAPASGASIVATWTNIISPEIVASASTSKPQNVDFFGDGTCQSGADSAMFCKAPGGVDGHIFSGYGTDKTYMMNSAAPSNVGYQFGGIGYSQMISFLYGTKFPALVPGASASVPFMTTGQWRIEGPELFSATNLAFDGVHDQWTQDIATKSTFSGTIASNILTLTANAVGPMWEGEIVNCAPVTTNCANGALSGVYITSLASGAWGVSGSTYALAGSPANVSVASAMQNPVYYSGAGSAYYLGTLNDIIVQTTGLAGTTGRAPHPSNGFTGGRRATSRWAAMIYGANGGNASDPKVDRVKADASGCDSSSIAAPCFDVGATYQASHAATWSGNTVTISGGLTAHARPFVVGQAFSCASCASGLVITSLSVPPTQSTAAGAGEVGQTFTFTANNAAGAPIGGSGTGTVTGGCAAGGTNGSNCIDVAIAINNGGTFGTAAALDTCGANNLSGNAGNYEVPNGKCQGSGIGEIVRAFQIGTQQTTYGNGATAPAAGSVFDDGVDIANGAFNQSAAFTCNIVASKLLQCVKGPAYSSGVLSGVGNWPSATTFISYGDLTVVSGRIGSLLGYVGGQSFPFTAGSGMSPNSTITETATCSPLASGAGEPRFDVTVSGGSIVNVVPSTSAGLGLGGTCTVPITGFSGGTLGSVNTIQLAPLEGEGGIATYNTDSNTMGMFLYDNSGEPGNPFSSFFTNGQGGYFEPGLPVRPFGLFQGEAVSG
jgi:hypothetical protein